MKKINWTAVFAWGTIALFWLAVAVAALFLLTACTTHQQLTEHHVRTIVADMMATELQADTHTNHTVVNVDSMVSSSVRTAFAEWQSEQTEKETTTETITTYVDSLGRAVRQEQRTTQRELSRQEQQRYQQQIQQMQLELQRQLSSLDSTYALRLQQVEQHLTDSLAAHRDLQKQTAAPALTWWQRTWSWLRGLLAGAAIALIYIIGRRHLRKLTSLK